MRFLLVNRFFGGELTPTGRMARDVAVELLRLGHEVTVLLSRSDYTAQQGSSALDGREFDLRYVREYGGGRFVRWSCFWIEALSSVSRRYWDRCLLLTDPPFLPFAAWLTRHCRTRRQLVYWWTMDIYPEALVASGRTHERSPINRILRWMNELGLRCLDGVIVLGPRQLQRLETYRKWKTHANFVTVVPPWDLRPIKRVEIAANCVLKRFGAYAKKVALYAGNLGEGHLFEQLVDAAKWFYIHKRTDWLFLFVVQGVGRHKLMSLASDLPNVLVIDYLPVEETADLLWSATVHLITMKPGWEGVIVPSKLYGTLQTRAPILFLGPTDSDTAMELIRTGRGLSLPPTASSEEVRLVLDELAGPGWVRGPVFDAHGPRSVAEFVTR